MELAIQCNIQTHTHTHHTTHTTPQHTHTHTHNTHTPHHTHTHTTPHHTHTHTHTHRLLNSIVRKCNPPVLPVRYFYRQLHTADTFLLNPIRDFFVSQPSFFLPLSNFLFVYSFIHYFFRSLLLYHPTSFLSLYLRYVATSLYPQIASHSILSLLSVLFSIHNCFVHIRRQSN